MFEEKEKRKRKEENIAIQLNKMGVLPLIECFSGDL